MGLAFSELCAPQNAVCPAGNQTLHRHGASELHKQCFLQVIFFHLKQFFFISFYIPTTVLSPIPPPTSSSLLPFTSLAAHPQSTPPHR